MEENILQTAVKNLKEPVRADVGNSIFEYLPPGWVKGDITSSIKMYPPWIEASPRFGKVQSFLEYADMMDAKDARIFANDESFQVTAVMDPYEPGEPSYQRHQAILVFRKSPEWELWKNISCTWQGPSEFRRFLENNLEYIVGDFSGAKVLEMCRDLNVSYKGEASVVTKGSGAEREIQFSENANAVGRGVRFPESLDVKLRIFKNSAAFTFKARLRVHIEGQHKVLFSIDLMDAGIVEENAFAIEIGAIEKYFESPVLYGLPG